VQKGKQLITFALASTYGTPTMVLHKEGVYSVWLYDREKVPTGMMVDEKVSVISIFPEIAHFFVLKLGTH
jgi:hypothetical protein